MSLFLILLAIYGFGGMRASFQSKLLIFSDRFEMYRSKRYEGSINFNNVRKITREEFRQSQDRDFLVFGPSEETEVMGQAVVVHLVEGAPPVGLGWFENMDIAIESIIRKLPPSVVDDSIRSYAKSAKRRERVFSSLVAPLIAFAGAVFVVSNAK